MRGLVLAALTFACCEATLADVRVATRPSGVHVDVRTVSGSAWLPTQGGSPGWILNPQGAATNDGHPGIHSGPDRTVVAWLRGATSELVVTSIDAAGNEEGRFSIEVEAPSGIPLVHRRAQDWLVLWQREAPSVTVEAVPFDPTVGLGEVVTLQAGRVLEANVLGDGLATLSIDQTNALVISIVRLDRIQPTPNPIPEQLVRIDMANPLSAFGLSSAALEVRPCVRTTDDRIVVAWPTRSGWERMVVTADDVDGPIAVRGGGDCSSVLNPAGGEPRDGHSRSSGTRDRVVVAWLQEATSELIVTSVDGLGREEGRHSVPVQGFTGMPVVHPMSGTWMIVWQQTSPAVVVRAVMFEPGVGLGEVVTLQDGVLLESSELGGDVVTVSVATETATLLVTKVPSLRPQPFPIPEQVFRIDMTSGAGGSSALASERFTGMPVVHTMADSWMVVWQQSSPAVVVRAVMFEPGVGLGEVVTLQDGVLLESSELGGEVVTLSVATETATLVVTKVPSWRPTPQPIPEQLFRINMTSAVGTSVAPARASAEILPCVRTRDDVIVVAWPTRSGWYERVLVTADDVDGPLAIRGGNDCSSVLNPKRE